jgi:MFS family permease
MAFLCVLSFLTYFDRQCITRAQGDIQSALDISSKQMGWIFAAFWFAYAFFEIPGGWLGDRYGAKGTLLRIVIAWSILTALTGAATGFLTLLFWRFLFGVGEAGAYPNMARVQSNWLPILSRARAGGMLWLMARWGAAFAPLIFGSLIRFYDSLLYGPVDPLQQHGAEPVSWRFAFWTAGAIGAVWCALFYFWFREKPADHPACNKAEQELIARGRPAHPEKHAMEKAQWRALFRTRSLWALGILYICNSFGWSFYVSWAPKYLKEVHHVEFAQSEIMSGLPLFFGGISCLVGGVLSDYLVRRTGRKWLFRALFPMCGYATAALAMFAIRFTDTPEEATVLLCIANAAGDFGQGANWATIVDIGGRFAGVAAGFINMVGNAGNYLQPPIGAWVFSVLGWNALFALYATMYLIAASMWFLVDPTRRFHDQADETARAIS